MRVDNGMKCRHETQFDVLCAIVPRSWCFMSKPHSKSLYPCLGKWFWRWDSAPPIWLLVELSLWVRKRTCLLKDTWETQEPRGSHFHTEPDLKEERPVSVTTACEFPFVYPACVCMEKPKGFFLYALADPWPSHKPFAPVSSLLSTRWAGGSRLYPCSFSMVRTWVVFALVFCKSDKAKFWKLSLHRVPEGASLLSSA